MLTLHTTGDGVVPQANEQGLARVVRQAGAERFLRQLSVRRAGHCSFTLNMDARRLGTRANAVDESDAYRTTEVAPQFIRDDSPPYLRPAMSRAQPRLAAGSSPVHR